MEQRFLEGFTRFLQDKKRQAVTTLLQEELPHLAQSDHFINNVLNKLDDTVVEEKRFVFLVLNPKLKQS